MAIENPVAFWGRGCLRAHPQSAVPSPSTSAALHVLERVGAVSKGASPLIFGGISNRYNLAAPRGSSYWKNRTPQSCLTSWLFASLIDRGIMHHSSVY